MVRSTVGKSEPKVAPANDSSLPAAVEESLAGERAEAALEAEEAALDDLAASGNDRVLAFYKSTPGHGNVVLVAISLDPFLPQSARIEAPFWLFGQADAGELVAEDLLTESRETWHEKTRALTLSPDQPYRVWRLSLHG